MIEDLIRSIVKRSDVDYLEIRVEKGEKTGVEIKGRSLETLKRGRFFGGNARVLVGSVWGFVYFNSLDEIKRKVEDAISQAKTLKGLVKDKTILAPVDTVEVKFKPKLIKHPNDVSLEEKVKTLMKYNEIFFSAGNEIVGTFIRYNDTVKKVYFANSEGTYVEQDVIDIGSTMMVIASNGKETQRSKVGFGSSNDISVMFGLEDEVKEKAKLAIELLNAKEIKGGNFPVVIDQELGGVFIHEAFGHLSEGDNIYENENLKRIMKIGRVFGSEGLNVFDTGDMEGKRGFVMYDSEGVKTKKVYLIKNGVLYGRLHSRETAGKMNEEATGNGRAISYNFPPIPRMRITCIENGKVDFSDLIRDVKFGVYAKGAFGGQTNGELFTFVPEVSYIIRDGKISEMVKNISLSGNVFTTLKNIVGIGNDFEIHDSGGGCGKGNQYPLPVSHGSPHILISNALVGGKG